MIESQKLASTGARGDDRHATPAMSGVAGAALPPSHVGTQIELDGRNARFWNELCGSQLARSVGISGREPGDLDRFDQAYRAMYPYLAGYVDSEKLAGKRVLEIGLGFGTLGQMIASTGCHYHGLDIAAEPVGMMRWRLRALDPLVNEKVVQGSALAIPWPGDSFDLVYTIGCLHHTGDLPRAVSEVRRVLRPRGKAIVMLYHRQSLRYLLSSAIEAARKLVRGLRGSSEDAAERVRARYDTNLAGDAAPHTDYVSCIDVRRLFRGFSHVRIDIRNFDSLPLLIGLIRVPRELFLDNLARLVGTDCYIVATK